MKPINQWTEEELRFLADKKMQENLEREYKQTLAVASPSERKELCKDASAFANSEGGIIIFGLAESGLAGSGSIPTELTPIPDHSAKEVAQQVLLDGIKPTIQFRFYAIPSSTGNREYVLLDIPKSQRGLHMVTIGNENRFYIRRDFQRVPMTPFEIEEAYMRYAKLDSDLSNRLQRYRIPNPNSSVRSPLNAWFSLTVIPIFPTRDLFAEMSDVPPAEIPRKARGMRSSRAVIGADCFVPNYHGLRAEGRGGEGMVAYRHQIFREGGIYLGRTIRGFEPERHLPALAVTTWLHDFMALAMGLFLYAGYPGRVRALVAIEAIQRFTLGAEDALPGQGNVFEEREFIHEIDTTVREATDSMSSVLEGLQHHFWQSFGHGRCDLYAVGMPGHYVHRAVDGPRFIVD